MNYKGIPLREFFHSARSGMYFVKLGESLWSHVTTEDGPAQVGPLYKSRSELLLDSRRFCREYGIDC